MTQTATILSKVGAIRIELPSADIELMPGVKWGPVDAFPTPAYWFYQVAYRRLQGGPPQYKLGRTLAEEVGACLLGGHGIPAPVGIAAYERLRAAHVFSGEPPSEGELLSLLSQPLQVQGRSVRYRFVAQKSRYLAAALKVLHAGAPSHSGRQLRDWLKGIPGIGFKTASWVARNWCDADDVAILDIHILRFGKVIGLFPETLTVERHYLELERLFLDFSQRLDVRPSELDAVIWHEMANSPLTVRSMMSLARGEPFLARQDTSTGQLPLAV